MTRCNHGRTQIREWDNGVCRYTGYHDEGSYIQCLDCRARFDAEEWREELAAIARERAAAEAEGEAA